MQMAFSLFLLQMSSPSHSMFTSRRFSGEPGKDGCTTTPPWLVSVARSSTSKIFWIPTVTLCQPHKSRLLSDAPTPSPAHPRTQQISHQVLMIRHALYGLFLPFSLPLPPHVSVQECFPLDDLLVRMYSDPTRHHLSFCLIHCVHNNLSENPSLTSVALLKSKHLSRHRLQPQ